MLERYYPVHTQEELQTFTQTYVPFVLNQLEVFRIDYLKNRLYGDHLGLQVLSAEEFEAVNKSLLGIAKLVNRGVIHSRRNNIYKFNQFPKFKDIEIQSIEIFEPKPGVDLTKLKPGIEHIAFKAENFDNFLVNLKKNKLPIDKEDTSNSDKFFKSKLINMVEIEFRNDFLWKKFDK